MDTLNQIKQALNIVDVISQYLELKKAGRNYKGVCPFHSEKTPSFMVSPEMQRYKCFGCGEAGDMFNFVQKVEGIDFVKTVEILAEKAGVKYEKIKVDPNAEKKKILYQINAATAEFFHVLLLKHPAGKKAMDYTKNSRKLTLQTISDFKLGFAPATWDTLFRFLTKRGFKNEDMLAAGLVSQRSNGQGYIDKFRNRLMFPFIDIDGKIIGFTGRALDKEQTPKYLNTPETLVFHKGSYLYALDKAKLDIKDKGAVFVEGQVDVLSAHQNGLKNVIASSGTALTPTQIKIVSRYTNKIFFCFDSDSAGQNAIYRAIDIADQFNIDVQIIKIPKNYTDLDELLKNDMALAKETFSNAVSIYDFYISYCVAKFDTKTAHGKKQALDEIVARFFKIKNDVIKDHYTKKVAETFDVSKETVEKLVNDYTPEAVENAFASHKPKVQKATENDRQKHLLALLFSAKLETAQNILYKLAQKDFLDPQLQKVFIAYKSYIINRKIKANLEKFVQKLIKINSGLAPYIEEILLEDLGDLTEKETLFDREINLALKRLKQDTIERELTALNEEMRLAETAHDYTKRDELREKAYKISKQKKQYEQ